MFTPSHQKSVQNFWSSLPRPSVPHHFTHRYYAWPLGAHWRAWMPGTSRGQGWRSAAAAAGKAGAVKAGESEAISAGTPSGKPAGTSTPTWSTATSLSRFAPERMTCSTRASCFPPNGSRFFSEDSDLCRNSYSDCAENWKLLHPSGTDGLADLWILWTMLVLIEACSLSFTWFGLINDQSFCKSLDFL